MEWFWSINWKRTQWLDQNFFSFINITNEEMMFSWLTRKWMAFVFFWRKTHFYDYITFVRVWFDYYKSMLEIEFEEVFICVLNNSVAFLLTKNPLNISATERCFLFIKLICGSWNLFNCISSVQSFGERFSFEVKDVIIDLWSLKTLSKWSELRIFRSWLVKESTSPSSSR